LNEIGGGVRIEVHELYEAVFFKRKTPSPAFVSVNGKEKTSRQLHDHKGNLLWHTFRSPREFRSRNLECAVEDVIHGDTLVSGTARFDSL
jgi:hypothetical protein